MQAYEDANRPRNPENKFRATGVPVTGSGSQPFEMPDFPVNEIVHSMVDFQVGDNASGPGAAIGVAASVKQEAPGEQAGKNGYDVNLDAHELRSKAN